MKYVSITAWTYNYLFSAPDSITRGNVIVTPTVTDSDRLLGLLQATMRAGHTGSDLTTKIVGALGSSVGRASDSGSRSPGIETRAGHLVVGSDFT